MGAFMNTMAMIALIFLLVQFPIARCQSDEIDPHTPKADKDCTTNLQGRIYGAWMLIEAESSGPADNSHSLILS